MAGVAVHSLPTFSRTVLLSAKRAFESSEQFYLSKLCYHLYREGVSHVVTKSHVIPGATTPAECPGFSHTPCCRDLKLTVADEYLLESYEDVIIAHTHGFDLILEQYFQNGDSRATCLGASWNY